MENDHVSKITLTVIVPVRWSEDRPDLIERISYLKHDEKTPTDVEFIVIDDGSTQSSSLIIQNTCIRNSIRYHRIDSELDVFSVGRARNVGAQLASNRFIMFQDVDLLPYNGFYNDVLGEIEIQKLNIYYERFLMFGVIYLTQAATQEYLSTQKNIRKNAFIQHLLDDDKSRIEKFSTGTSVTVWNRNYFLASGGNDPDFRGWGYEDIEFMCRAIRKVKKHPLPDEFALDYRNFQSITEYRGWKSIYRLFGDATFQKGIVLFHAWHPIKSEGEYQSERSRNRKLFEKKLAEFRDKREEPAPLPMPERGRSVIFRTNPWVNNRWIAPMLGEIVLLDEEMFSAETFIQFVAERNIDRVVFHNPYANEKMHSIYQAVKLHGIPYLVCERGALPGSVFFDPNGFNGESESYAIERWNKPLSMDQKSETKAYIRKLRSGDESLEDQPDRIGPQAVRKKLQISTGRKILFVPLQRPSDTVIEYLSGPIETYENFLMLVKRLSHCLPPDWIIVAKRHPLEVESPKLHSVIYADNYHINDLVEASDAILLINSGVGITGLVYEKPVLYAGTAFYGQPGLACQVKNETNVIDALNNFKPDSAAILCFLHYLLFEFYSFARFETRKVRWGDGAFMTSTTAIDYFVVRIPGCDEFRLEQRTTPEINHSSILFDRYKGGGNIHTNKKTATPPQKPVQQSIAIPQQKKRSTLLTLDLPLVRKANKLRNNPVMFLRDSQFMILRTLGNTITKY